MTETKPSATTLLRAGNREREILNVVMERKKDLRRPPSEAPKADVQAAPGWDDPEMRF